MTPENPVRTPGDHEGDCRRAREEICASIGAGRTPSPLEPWLAEHLDSCAECRALEQQQRMLWDLLGQYPLPVDPPAADFTQRVVAAIRGERRERRVVVLRFTALAAAACLLVAISLGVLGGGPADSERSQDREVTGVLGGESITSAPVEDPSGYEGDILLDDEAIDDVLGDLPAEDREVIALLHLAGDLPMLDQVDLDEISAIDVDLLPEDDLALELSGEIAGLLGEK